MEKYTPVSGGDNYDLPQWQKDMIDSRLKDIEENPQSVEDIEGLFEELDKPL